MSEQRAARVERSADSQISPEFLDAYHQTGTVKVKSGSNIH